MAKNNKKIQEETLAKINQLFGNYETYYSFKRDNYIVDFKENVNENYYNNHKCISKQKIDLEDYMYVSLLYDVMQNAPNRDVARYIKIEIDVIKKQQKLKNKK